MESIAEQYRDEIREFFEGKGYWESRGKGHIWVCEHGPFGTLTVEPKEGGQYEIAVRFPGLMDDDARGKYRHKYSGYYADKHGIMYGINTHGH